MACLVLLRLSDLPWLVEYRVSVTIILIDVNDEPPVFTMKPEPFLAVFDPSRPANSKVDYKITVRDTDATARLQYTLLEGKELAVSLNVVHRFLLSGKDSVDHQKLFYISFSECDTQM